MALRIPRVRSRQQPESGKVGHMSDYRHLCCMPAVNFAGWKYLAVLQPVPVTVVVVVVVVYIYFFRIFSNPAVV